MLSPIVAGVWRMASWNWSPQERLWWIEQCLDLGVTRFDHADTSTAATRRKRSSVTRSHSRPIRQRSTLDRQEWTDILVAATGKDVP
jgi:predicted oxidoreductase